MQRMRIKSVIDTDRREAIRVKKALSIQYQKGLRPSRAPWINTIAQDISETGLCIHTEKKVREATYMRLRIKLPTENSWLNITGKIVKCESAPIGHYWAHIKLSALGPMEKNISGHTSHGYW